MNLTYFWLSHERVSDTEVGINVAPDRISTSITCPGQNWTWCSQTSNYQTETQTEIYRYHYQTEFFVMKHHLSTSQSIPCWQWNVFLARHSWQIFDKVLSIRTKRWRNLSANFVAISLHDKRFISPQDCNHCRKIETRPSRMSKTANRTIGSTADEDIDFWDKPCHWWMWCDRQIHLNRSYIHGLWHNLTPLMQKPLRCVCLLPGRQGLVLWCNLTPFVRGSEGSFL